MKKTLTLIVLIVAISSCSTSEPEVVLTPVIITKPAIRVTITGTKPPPIRVTATNTKTPRPPTPKPKRAIIKCDDCEKWMDINLWSKPASAAEGAKVTGSINNNSVVDILNVSGIWTKVRLGSQTGWLKSTFIGRTSD